MAKLFIDASLVPNKLIASSLLVGLLSIISTTAIAQPSSAPSAEQSQPAPTKNTIAEQLQGQWQVKDPSSGQTLTLIFTQDGKFFMLLPLESGSGLAVPFGYRINPTPQPMHMDVLLPEDNQTVMTIFAFTPERRLRLQLAGTNPGQPRPTAFTSEAILFEKTSEATTLPPEFQLLGDPETQGNSVTSDLEEQTNQARESEGRNNMGAMNRAQQANYLEFAKFAPDIQELGIGIQPETENYRYQIVSQGNQRESVMMTAQAKRPELRSYTGAVFVVKSKDEDLTVATICETDEPSSTPPAMPTAPRQAEAAIQCPVGSHQLGR